MPSARFASLSPIASASVEPPAAAGRCSGCRQPGDDFAFTMAFQPIVDMARGEVFAHEALVRGPAGESAASILARVTDSNRYWFDQQCRIRAIELADRLGMREVLSINFMPNAVYRAEACIRATLEAAERTGFPTERIMFEVSESEQVVDRGHLKSIFREYRRCGFLTAIDDFGAGYAGLDLLADFQPDVAKIDMALLRGIDRDPARRIIVGHTVRMLDELGVRVIAEGVETRDEQRVLADLGVHLMQGYLFARPAFEALACLPEAAFASR